jgi:hypothetical protein
MRNSYKGKAYQFLVILYTVYTGGAKFFGKKLSAILSPPPFVLGAYIHYDARVTLNTHLPVKRIGNKFLMLPGHHNEYRRKFFAKIFRRYWAGDIAPRLPLRDYLCANRRELFLNFLYRLSINMYSDVKMNLINQKRKVNLSFS